MTTEGALVDFLVKSVVSGGPAALVLVTVMGFLVKGALRELRANTEAIKELQANSASAEKLQKAATEISDTRQALALITQRLDFLSQAVTDLSAQVGRWSAMAAKIEYLETEVEKLRDWKHDATEELALLKGRVDMLERPMPRTAVGS
jgi:chromosome segregation ATPase